MGLEAKSKRPLGSAVGRRQPLTYLTLTGVDSFRVGTKAKVRPLPG